MESAVGGILGVVVIICLIMAVKSMTGKEILTPGGVVHKPDKIDASVEFVVFAVLMAILILGVLFGSR